MMMMNQAASLPVEEIPVARCPLCGGEMELHEEVCDECFGNQAILRRLEIHAQVPREQQPLPPLDVEASMEAWEKWGASKPPKIVPRVYEQSPAKGER